MTDRSGSALFTELLGDGLDWWVRGAGCAQKLLKGEYGPGDAVADADALVAAWATLAVQLSDAWWGGPVVPALSGDWSSTMQVLPEVAQRPLTLRTDGLYALDSSGSAYQVTAAPAIPPGAVTFVPPVLEAGRDTFRVEVKVPRSAPRTQIFLGSITAKETSGVVSDPIRANNRDGGPAG